MPKNAYICTMSNPLLKGVDFRKGSYWRKVYVPLLNGKYRREYFNLQTSDIKIAEKHSTIRIYFGRMWSA